MKYDDFVIKLLPSFSKFVEQTTPMSSADHQFMNRVEVLVEG